MLHDRQSYAGEQAIQMLLSFLRFQQSPDEMVAKDFLPPQGELEHL